MQTKEEECGRPTELFRNDFLHIVLIVFLCKVSSFGQIDPYISYSHGLCIFMLNTIAKK